MTIHYCVHKGTKEPLSAGRVPAVWGQISGLADVTGDELANLSWAGYPDHGFLTEEQALAHGVSQEALDAALEVASSAEGDVVRAERNKRLSACDWTQMPDATVDKEVWVTYRNALRDVTNQAGFPWSVTWPEQPA